MKKVIIIGAGPAGLTAAYELLKDNSGEYDVTIIEETSALGGISRTVNYKGNRMDMGGHRFFSKIPEKLRKLFSTATLRSRAHIIHISTSDFRLNLFAAPESHPSRLRWNPLILTMCISY